MPSRARFGVLASKLHFHLRFDEVVAQVAPVCTIAYKLDRNFGLEHAK